MASIIGAILKGKKVGQKMLRAHRIKHGKRGETISTVKPMSGKIPWYVGAGKKDPEKRAEIVKTHFALKRSEKINKAEQKIKEGKTELKKMVDTGQAEEYKNLPGRHKRKGFNK